ncbi:hypothetical protein DCAR_0311742 [Daucus carota subsp. sativus]|uniref:Uncharacterized protein n=1 Tax=Daucus carota subsp. sativus TaxID=79200 RepID=A0A161XXZ0_DAUCS|nr:hypothetical protein DCAR_0311742 [Daucus carota subsp. sativus]
MWSGYKLIFCNTGQCRPRMCKSEVLTLSHEALLALIRQVSRINVLFHLCSIGDSDPKAKLPCSNCLRPGFVGVHKVSALSIITVKYICDWFFVFVYKRRCFEADNCVVISDIHGSRNTGYDNHHEPDSGKDTCHSDSSNLFNIHSTQGDITVVVPGFEDMGVRSPGNLRSE